MSHNQILHRFEAEVALLTAKNHVAGLKLRQELVEKYGEDGVAKVEAKVIKDREAQYAGH